MHASVRCMHAGVARSLVKKLPTLTNADGATILNRLVKVVQKLQSRLAAMVDQQSIATAVRAYTPCCTRARIRTHKALESELSFETFVCAQQASAAYGDAAANAAGDRDGSPVVSGSPSPPRENEGNATDVSRHRLVASIWMFRSCSKVYWNVTSIYITRQLTHASLSLPWCWRIHLLYAVHNYQSMCR